MIYLDNAATTWPKPESVYREMDRFFRLSAANPGRSGHRMALAAEQAIERTRLALARLFNIADPNRIAFACNATDALNTALKGLLRPGDHVVTSSVEHNSVLRPLKGLEKRGVTVTKVAASPAGWIDPNAIARAIGPETRMIVTTHVSNVTGTIEPVAAIGALARQRNLLYLVDGAQSAGTLPIDLAALPVDLFAFTGHKGLFGPPGTGGLCIGERVAMKDFSTLREGGTGTRSEEELQPSELPQRFEAGTPNTVGIVGLGAGVEFLVDRGVANVREQETLLMDRLAAGLRKISALTVYGPEAAQERGAVVSFNVAGWRPADLGTILDQRFAVACRTGLHCAPEAAKTIGAFPLGTVRLSLSIFNTAEEIDLVLGYVKQIAGSPPL
ncbi:MAG: aminotransferase class V-fold PLP-dependent enzyme [Deltaproteobacteria bacterium]|nr:aminotransferase class V-fold PLP-dependent enzyme [Deltaproteobacteria bacterium]